MSDPKIYILKHVEFEGPGFIKDWLKKHDKCYETVNLYAGDSLPDLDTNQISGLIIMGGPMNIYKEDKYRWMKPEKDLIRYCIENEIPTLGICLGSQFIADALGSDVYRHKYKEIGWFKVNQIYDGSFESELDEYTVFHWHGETFDAPEGSIHLFESEACEQQGFQYGEHVIALQCHLELGRKEIKDLEKHLRPDLKKGRYVQKWDEIEHISDKKVKENKELLFNILKHLFD
jgi:GMP synthase (glutamine-hydrolysing)